MTQNKAGLFDIQHCHVELYLNPANLAPGVKYGPNPGVIMAEKMIQNPDKSSSADVSRVSRSHDQDGHHTIIW